MEEKQLKGKTKILRKLGVEKEISKSEKFLYNVHWDDYLILLT